MSERMYKRLKNGDVAGVGLMHQKLNNIANYMSEKANYTMDQERIASRLAPQNIRVSNIEATVQPSMQKAKNFMNYFVGDSIKKPNALGEMIGRSPEGVNTIMGAINNYQKSMPANQVLEAAGASQDLHDRYERILQKKYPEQFFKGFRDGNYVASPQMHPSWIKYLSKVLPVANAPEVLGVANQMEDIQKRGGGWITPARPRPEDIPML